MMLTAFIVLGSLMMVGLVVDLGQLRVDRRTNKSIADIAARAGVGRLAFGPWSGVCKAREFVLGNAKGFSSFDAGSETWSNAEALVYGSDPCPAVVSSPDTNPCKPNLPSSWAKLQATAGNGRFTIEIQSGYVLPDPRFPSDASMGDTGTADQGSCDNLAVIISERQAPSFAQVGGGEPTVVRTRSVGRLNSTETLDFIAALQLLERTKCDVLSVSGANTRVVAQAYKSYPGTIQIDSAGPSGSCQSPILNAGQGPSVVACSANSTLTTCRPGIGDRPSRVGVYAANFNRAASDISTAYGTHYGDTKVIGSPRTGRKYTDKRYRQNVHTLDQDAEAVLTGTSGLPPGCVSVSADTRTCTGNGLTWLVVEPADCTSLGVFFAVAGRTSAQNIWFNCDLNVSSPLTLSASNAYIVVRGQLAVNSAFTVTDPRKVYVGGRAGGNDIGLDLTSPTGVLNMNLGSASACSGRTGPDHANKLVVGKGSVKVGSGFTVRLCQTLTFLASGYDKVPATDGTLPCTCAYTGTIDISSGSTVDLSAPNEITGRLPADSELATTNKFEDLALWVEAGGGGNGLAGGAFTKLAGVFFLPNANPFKLTGGGTSAIDLSAQFVSTTLTVTGGSTVNLVPNPEDSIPVRVPNFLLVR